jgi:2-dehydro-3-deoxyphosphogluconate aldolase/(4S)-4-hydroxy-2-oxoglutarate aldolase
MPRCDVIKKIVENKIFAVVRTSCKKSSIDISKALIEGGIKNIEITIGCKDVEEAISVISKIDGITVAAGSIITIEQAERAILAGAKLIVSPVLEVSLMKYCRRLGVPLITTASTTNEAYSAWKLGVDIIKLFPSKELGGVEYLKDMLKTMPFLPLMPTGGVDVENFSEYLEAGAKAVGIGKDFYDDENDLPAITKKAALATQKLKNIIQTDR